MSLARDLVKSGVMGGWVAGCVGGWKERKMDVVGRRYGKGLSNEEEVREKKVLSGEEEKVKMYFCTENCEVIRQVL